METYKELINIKLFGCNISWNVFGNIPELYLLLVSIVGLIWVNTFNFEPRATNESKLWIMPGMVAFALNSLWITLLLLIVQWLYCFEKVLISFHSYWINDGYTMLLKSSVILTMIIICLLNKNEWLRHVNPQRESPILILLLTLCLFILISAYNFMTAFFGIISFSLIMYVLILGDGFKTSAREAGIKYFYLSTTSSGVLLCGIFLSYLIFHSTSFLSINWLIHNWILFETIKEKEILLTILLYFIIFGFLFKLAAFPGHLWAPEVYNGSPNFVTALFLLPIKMATLALFIRILNHTFGELYVQWVHLLWISSFFSMSWGCLGALVEQNIKKFLAYSSINQIGFLLIGLTTGTTEGVKATLLYLLLYIMMYLGFLLIYLTTEMQLLSKTKIRPRFVENYQKMKYLTDFNIFAKYNTLQTIGLIVILFSMAGIPPLGGFFGKYFLFLHSFETGNIGLVLVGMITSVIATYYYLRLIKILLFEKKQEFVVTNLDRKYISYLQQPTSMLFNVYVFVTFFLILFIFLSPTLLIQLEKVTAVAIHPISQTKIIFDTIKIS